MWRKYVEQYVEEARDHFEPDAYETPRDVVTDFIIYMEAVDDHTAALAFTRLPEDEKMKTAVSMIARITEGQED
jgi:hypothetical protein